LGTTYYYMNMEYRPPVPITRTVLKIVSPVNDDSVPARFTNTVDQTESESLKKDDSQEEFDDLEQEQTKGPQDQEPAPDLEQGNSTAQKTPTEGGQTVADTPLEDGEGKISRPDLEDSEGPGRIQSRRSSSEVSETGSPSLADKPSFGTEFFGDPEHLLSLFPWPSNVSGDDINLLLHEYLGWDLDTYPSLYREHIENYYKELIAWQRKTTVTSGSRLGESGKTSNR
jgi:hypothetical protein